MAARNLIGMLFVIVSSACASCPTDAHTPRLSNEEVVRIAGEAARREGFEMADYDSPGVHFEYLEKDCTWTVSYEGKDQMPDNRFVIIVDDKTRRTRFLPGA